MRGIEILTAGTVVCSALAGAAAAQHDCDGWLVFMSQGPDASYDVMGMAPDGSGLTNISDDLGVLSYDPAIDGHGLGVTWYGGTPNNASIYWSDFAGRFHTTLVAGGNVVSPAFSEDGSRLAYVRVGGEQLWVANADGSGGVQVGDGSWPNWHPRAHALVYSKWASGSVGSIRLLDLDTLTVTQLTPGGGFRDLRPEWSPDGQRIVFGRLGAPNGSHVWVMNADGSGQVDLTAVSGLTGFSPSWSPAGDRIAFIRDDVRDVWVMDADGSNPVQLTNTPWEETEVNWGRRADGMLVYQTDETGSNRDINGVRPDGTGWRDISQDPGVISAEPNISPDGETIVWYGGTPTDADIFISDPWGGGKVQVAIPGDAVTPDVSPDGRRMAYVLVGGEQLWIADLDGGNAAMLTSGSWPDWSPCGTNVVYSKWASATVGSIRVIDIQSLAVTVLTPGLDASNFKDIQPEYSRDGSRIAFARIDNTTNEPSICVMNADGSGLVNLSASNGVGGLSPSWSVDDSFLAFTHDDDVWVMRADGSDPTPVMVTPFAEQGVFWGDTAGCPWDHNWHRTVPGLAGASGTPDLSGWGCLEAGTDFAIELEDARPFSMAWFVLGVSSLYAPFKGGTLVPAPDIVLGLATDGGGDIAFGDAWPGGLPAGVQAWMQYWIQDASGPVGFTASNGLRLTTP